ncbi:MAG: stage V sporulation protein AA [Butyrivibrio sp.]|nr:stage V sporulation protein AA [Butyrivibrio sp.]
MSETVYISFSKNTEVHKRKVKMSDVASVWCADGSVAARVKAITVVNVPEVKSRRFVFTVMKMVELIKKECPNAEINNIGVPEFVVSYKEEAKPNPLAQWLKVAAVSLIVFFGGAFAIMAYGNDIDVNSVFGSICEFVTGGDRWLVWMQSAYCLGLAGGIIVFYNHLGRRRYEKDPTPLEVEMRLYEDEVNTAVINDSVREGKAEDVD